LINATKLDIAELRVAGRNEETRLLVLTGAIFCCSLYGVRSRRSRIVESGKGRIVNLISIGAYLEHAAGQAATRHLAAALVNGRRGSS
jgi:NAD(P)-dependent dehydrogenase (short-subunit alcohol dehydrogenase family)